MTKDNEGFNISEGKRIADEFNVRKALTLWKYEHVDDDFFGTTPPGEPSMLHRYSDKSLQGVAIIIADRLGFKPDVVLFRAALSKLREEQSLQKA